MRVRFRLFVQPLDGHGTTEVSGMSREVNGPSLRRRSRISRRNESLACSQLRERS